jgi:hypothetical protein
MTRIAAFVPAVHPVGKSLAAPDICVPALRSRLFYNVQLECIPNFPEYVSTIFRRND